MVESGSGGGKFFCVSSVKGTWREGSLDGKCEGYVEKALEMDISFHRSSVWGTSGRAHLLGNGELDEGTLGMEHLSLKTLLGGGLGRRSFSGNPGSYTKKFSRYSHQTPWGPFKPRGTWYLGVWTISVLSCISYQATVFVMPND